MRYVKETLARRLVGVVAMLLAVGPAVVVAAPSAEAATASPAMTAAYQVRIVQRINAVRAFYGRGPLWTANCPTWFAIQWSNHLASTGTFYHQSMYPILRVCRASKAAENLARGNVSADSFVAAWLASPGHCANILDPALNRIGISAVYASGQWTITTDFARF
jgi:uncharacterized protein YkwD